MGECDMSCGPTCDLCQSWRTSLIHQHLIAFLLAQCLKSWVTLDGGLVKEAEILSVCDVHVMEVYL